MNIDKLRKNTIPYNELEKKYMEDYEYQKEYLNLSLEEYITDCDFNKFYKSLEKVIKSRESISSFAKKVNIDRSNLYTLFNGEKSSKVGYYCKNFKRIRLYN